MFEFTLDEVFADKIELPPYRRGPGSRRPRQAATIVSLHGDLSFVRDPAGVMHDREREQLVAQLREEEQRAREAERALRPTIVTIDANLFAALNYRIDKCLRSSTFLRALSDGPDDEEVRLGHWIEGLFQHFLVKVTTAGETALREFIQYTVRATWLRESLGAFSEGTQLLFRRLASLDAGRDVVAREIDFYVIHGSHPPHAPLSRSTLLHRDRQCS